jgi:hypothetical protein
MPDPSRHFRDADVGKKLACPQDANGDYTTNRTEGVGSALDADIAGDGICRRYRLTALLRCVQEGRMSATILAVYIETRATALEISNVSGERL